MLGVARVAAITGNLAFGLMVDVYCLVPLFLVAGLLTLGGLLAMILPSTQHQDLAWSPREPLCLEEGLFSGYTGAVSAYERRRYVYNMFSHWLRPFSRDGDNVYQLRLGHV